MFPFPFHCRASLRVTDSYIHVPGFHPTVDNPSFFHQRVDDPSVLPSLHQHLWGRLASLGRFTLQVEKKVRVSDALRGEGSSATPGEGLDQGGLMFNSDMDPLVLSGEGSCVMVEWSQPTIIMMTRVLEHCRMEYADIFDTSSSLSSSSTSNSFLSMPSSSFSKGYWKRHHFPSFQLSFHLTDANCFLYALKPGKI